MTQIPNVLTRFYNLSLHCRTIGVLAMWLGCRVLQRCPGHTLYGDCGRENLWVRGGLRILGRREPMLAPSPLRWSVHRRGPVFSYVNGSDLWHERRPICMHLSRGTHLFARPMSHTRPPPQWLSRGEQERRVWRPIEISIQAMAIILYVLSRCPYSPGRRLLLWLWPWICDM